MLPIVTSDEMRGLDLETMQRRKISSWDLMKQVAEEMAEKLMCLEGPFLFLCGPGNNGGDGYVCAETLRKQGKEVRVLVVREPQSAEGRRAARYYRGLRSQDLGRARCIVDAVFGNGSRAHLEPDLARLFVRASRSKAFRVSLDIPSGVDSREGRVHPQAFQADLTLCVAYPKKIFLLPQVLELLGDVVYVGKDFAGPNHTQFFVLEDSDYSIGPLRRTSHKGHHGRVGILGGSSSTPGAPFLAAEAAYRVGAGYVSVFFAENKNLRIKVSDASFLLKMKWSIKDLQKETTLVMGPGGSPRSLKFLREFQGSSVIDADAIRWAKTLKGIQGRSVLTPHPGEAARMLGISVAEVQKNPVEALDRMVEASGQSVYLKGCPAYLKFPWEPDKYYVNLLANPIFAKAGSGDVLSGILGGFLAQNPHDFKSSVVSALVFQKHLGEVLRSKGRAVMASDQLEVFSEAHRRLRA